MSGPARLAASIACVLGLLATQPRAATPPAVAWAVAVFPSGAEFQLEIAADAASRRRGYMFRDQVGPREGMLFIFDREEPQAFWMKNCRVPLDMIFLDDAWTVVEIAHEQQPCPPHGPCPNVAPLRFSRYVLEVAGGVARQESLRVGDRVTVLSEPALP